MSETNLQALVYDILPSATAVFSYVILSRKLSANEQFFVGAQTVVRLLQTTQIISDVCFITQHVAYASSDQTKIVWRKVPESDARSVVGNVFSACPWRRLVHVSMLLPRAHVV